MFRQVKNMKKYFSLYSTTYFYKLGKEGCLYNTLNGEVVALSQEQSKLIKKVENGMSTECIKAEERNFLDILEEHLLGEYGEKPFSMEPTFWGENNFYKSIAGSKRSFEILQIELAEECNCNCIFCDKNSELVYRKTGCKCWKTNSENRKLKLEEWIKYIQEAKKLGCKKIQFFGGEPLLEWDLLKELIIISQEISIQEIEIFTNGILLDDNKVKFLQERAVKTIIQISNMDNNKEILGIDKDIDYLDILRSVKEKNLDFEILLLISRYNDQYLEKYKSLYSKNRYPYSIDFIMPYPNNSFFSEKYKSYILDYKNKLLKCNPINLGVLMLYNPCYMKTIAISKRGYAYPCIMSRFVTYGVLDGENSLESVLKEKYETMKYLSKNKMTTCKECLYKYACVNCSAIEISASDGIFGCKNCSKIKGNEE